MPPRNQPTARQERLGTELRKMRDAAGMTAREAAALLGTNPMQMSHMETGRAGISEERLRRLASHYVCADTELVDGLVALATDRTRGWWEEYRGVLPPSFLDLSELEHHATFLHTVDPAYVPGLLQTEEYANAVFSYTVPELSSGELQQWIAHRMHRRIVLDRECPTKYVAVIHESALRIKVGNRRIARDQVKQILTLTDRDHVTVRMIPFAIDGFAGAGCAMLHAGGPVPKLDTIQRDAPHGSGFLDAESQLARFRKLYRRTEKLSLNPERSQELMCRIIEEL